jgi:DNA-binding transcriptional regulator YiaG
MKFANQLKDWRGLRTQEQAAKILRVKIDRYRKWEQGAFEPQGLMKCSLFARMSHAPFVAPAIKPNGK